MKYNITTLKKEVSKHIRLEVYKEALERKDWINGQGLCVGLPKIMLRITAIECLSERLDSETNKGMRYKDVEISFPEVTKKIVMYIETDLDPNTKRIEYLEQWIKELEGHSEQNNTEK